MLIVQEDIGCVKDAVKSMLKIIGIVSESRGEMTLIATCKDDSHTWRNSLTFGKEYAVIKEYDDPYAGYPMVEIMCNDGIIRPYRANRFDVKGDEE